MVSSGLLFIPFWFSASHNGFCPSTFSLDDFLAFPFSFSLLITTLCVLNQWKLTGCFGKAKVQHKVLSSMVARYLFGIKLHILKDQAMERGSNELFHDSKSETGLRSKVSSSSGILQELFSARHHDVKGMNKTMTRQILNLPSYRRCHTPKDGYVSPMWGNRPIFNFA